MDSELCVISADPTSVHTSLTMKLVHSVLPEYGTAVTMIKNILHTAYVNATNSQRWLNVVSAIREEEQVRTRAVGETQHGYSGVLRRPRGDFMGRGFNNHGASTSGHLPAVRAASTCHNCGSEDHFLYHYPKPRQPHLQGQFRRARGCGGRFGRGGGRSHNAMASTKMSQHIILDRIKQLSAALAEIQSGSSHAMSAPARGMYLKLHARILDTGCS